MHKKAFLYIVFAGILWGTSGLFVNVLAPMGLSALQITAIRGTVSAISMAGYLLVHNKKLFYASKSDILLYAFSGIAVFFTSAFYFLSMQASSVSTAVVLMYTAPVLVMIYSVAFLGEKFTSTKLVSLILVMFGSCLVSGIIGDFKYSVEGIILGLGAGIAYSAYNVITKIEMRRKCNPVTASMYSFTFMALVSILVSRPGGILEVLIKIPESSVYMFLCGLCTCVMPYFLYTFSLKFLPVGTAASLGIIEPMSATLFSVVLLGEKLGVYNFIGIVLILTAVFLLSNVVEEC